MEISHGREVGYKMAADPTSFLIHGFFASKAFLRLCFILGIKIPLLLADLPALNNVRVEIPGRMIRGQRGTWQLTPPYFQHAKTAPTEIERRDTFLGSFTRRASRFFEPISTAADMPGTSTKWLSSVNFTLFSAVRRVVRRG
jgi:hypothetical protein